VWALDADAVAAPGLGIRTTTAADRRSSPQATYLGPGSLAVADGVRIHGLLFAGPEPHSVVRPKTTSVALFTVAVGGVPAIYVEEALWICTELTGGGGPAAEC
jgi:hypothetical protein